MSKNNILRLCSTVLILSVLCANVLSLPAEAAYGFWSLFQEELAEVSGQNKKDKVDSEQQTPGTKDATSSSGKNDAIKDGQLPDLGLFLNCNRHEDQDEENAWYLSYKFSMDHGGMEAVEEVIDLLERPEYHLKLTEVVENDYTNVLPQREYNYYFEYTGAKQVKSFVPYGYDDSCEVYISVFHFYDQGIILLSCYFGDGLKTVDCGEKTEYTLADYNGTDNTITIDGSQKGSRKTVQCGVCNGTADCQSCGGDGYLYSRASDKEDRNCTACNTNRGKCFSCRGKGWLN